MNSNDPNYQNPHDPENNKYNSTYLQNMPVIPPPPLQRRQNIVVPAATTSGLYAQQQQQMVNVLFSIHPNFGLVNEGVRPLCSLSWAVYGIKNN